MKELTEEQISRILAMYVGQVVTGYMDGIMIKSEVDYHSITGLAERIKVRRGELLIKPLSTITAEAATELAKIMCEYWDEQWRVSYVGYPKPEFPGDIHPSILCIECKRYVQGFGPDAPDRYYKAAMIQIDTEDSTLNFCDYQDNGKILEDGYSFNTTLAHQYLIQQGYAVPLFIEPNHPLNGKTAIEMGIAIDSTKLTTGK